MALVCCHAALRLYQSSSNRCLKRINRSCLTQGRRSGRLHPASVTGWWGADVTGNSSWGAGAMLIVSADSDALYNCVKQFENQHTLAFSNGTHCKVTNEPTQTGLCTSLVLNNLKIWPFSWLTWIRHIDHFFLWCLINIFFSTNYCINLL